jgi:Tfp pilus assembly protein PilV
MKRTHLVAVLVLIVIALVFAYSQSPLQSAQTRQTATTTQTFTIERQVATQQRINRYFHGDVVPKLKRCWSSVQGKGTIALKYTYTKAGGRWMFNRLETEQSTLPRGQASIASRCMSAAVRGTSFPSDGTESTATTYVLKWTWPVPFPANAAQLTSTMFAVRANNGGSESGGCDGRGAPKKCYTCGTGGSCLAVCVGSTECKTTTEAKGGSSITTCEVTQGNCASGGGFGVTGGGMVIY